MPPRAPRRYPSPIWLLVVVALLVGIWLGGHPDGLPGFLRTSLVGDDQGRLVQEALDDVHSDYYRAVTKGKLADEAIGGMVKSLDDQFSNYLDPATYRDFNAASNPRFSGIGVNVESVPRGLKISSVLPGSPAQGAGLRAGDIIVEAGGKSLAGHPAGFATSLIRGKPGTQVHLVIVRGGRRRPLDVTRKQIAQQVTESRLYRRDGKKLGYVYLSTFQAGDAGDQVHAQTEKLLARGAQGIVLDLRHNGGGLLDQAVKVASVFVPKGPIVSTAGRSRPRHVYTATGGAIPGKIPVVVLVDRGTASSSEIVTGALQDRRRAQVVGTNTFGKGVFQEVRPLSNGGALDITVGQYFTPSGRNLGGGGVKEGKGITPDVRAVDKPGTRRDEARDAALATLAGQL